ncbi:fimbrillin family protein [Segatella copri]|uniref:fimbrillin family protein n=1 Tax=Segatella copri TaxID=165179 RepID=UPI00294AD511|nr:fimbrillin family protein [Segatella copri]WOF88012.1 fimbrillin family protein [Segatella copri]WOF94175.1 fimbrillin family protein [Segatella copri]
MGIAAVAALTLVSCSSDDLNSLSDNSSKNEAISFDGYWGRSAVSVNGSRGSVIDKAEDLQKVSEGFGVFGNYSSTDGEAFGSNLFENQKVTYSTEETKWTYSPKKYWSPQGHIDFLAYAPRVEGTKLKDNTSCIEFTVADKAADQKDLLWANAANQTMAKNSGTGKKVKFQFAHALSRLGYTVKTKDADAGTTITLNKITLAGSADGKTNAFYTKGTIDLSKDLPKPSTSITDLWATSNNDTKQKFDWFSGTQSLATTYTNPDTEYLFVIPQNFSKTTENADALYVIVEYTIKYEDEKTMTNKVSSQLKLNFEQGKAYTLNLTLGLTPIEFDVTAVEGWTDTNQGEINSWN